MKISKMDPVQAREIDALYNGALFICSDNEKDSLERIMKDSDSTYEEMVHAFKVFIDNKMKTDQNIKASIELYFRLRAISFHYSPDWRL